MMPSCTENLQNWINSKKNIVISDSYHIKEDNWSTDPLVLHSYSQDLWPRKLLELRERGPADPTVDLVIWPETTQEVSGIVIWASKVDAMICPYGAGSGVCGAVIPAANEKRLKVLIDLKKMHEVTKIDPVSMTVSAQTGIIGENLERALNQEGYTLGHFPSSIYCSTLGGYLAARSAGQFSTKYGKIEDMVLSLEVVLPNGKVVETSRAPRSAMGPDWTQLLLGSEGTLGVVTSATMQIHRLPEKKAFLSFSAKEISHAIHFARNLMQSGVRPAVIRIYDSLETSLTVSKDNLTSDHYEGGCVVVVLFEGITDLVNAEEKAAKHIAQNYQLRFMGPKMAEYWYVHRYDVSYKQQLILSHEKIVLDTFEIAATWDRLEQVYHTVKKTQIGFGMILAHLSHFYHTGANIYFTLVGHGQTSQKTIPYYDQVWEKILQSAFDSGATLSHHHGVGTQKMHWLNKEKGDLIEIYKKVKHGFDPENRFNANKMGC